MTDEMIEVAVQALIKRRRFGGTLTEQTQAAIKAYKEALAKAGLGIRPRKATKEMLQAASVFKIGVESNPPLAWQAMWDAHEKP